MAANILIFLQIIKFFVDLYHEKDAKKANEKSVVGKEIVDAIAQTDPKTRASRINASVDSINRLPK